jgi:hypothetical protein
MDDDMILTSSHVHELLTAVVSNLEQLCVVPLQWISSHGDEPGKKAAEGRVQHPTQPRSARYVIALLPFCFDLYASA